MDIYGTLGPACLDLECLKEMFELGMTGMRLNLSHITMEEAAPMIEIFRKAAKQAQIANPKLLIDMQGPEIRVGAMPEPIELTEGKELVLGSKGIPIPDFLCSFLKTGQILLLDDGKIKVQIREIDQVQRSAKGRVLRGGLLRERKSIAIENVTIPVPALSQQDLENLKLAKQYGVTGVMQPFVREKKDLQLLADAMHEAGCGNLAILAKIENRKGVQDLTDFFEVCDEIVIARGDLGNAMPLWELPKVQKQIAKACRKAKKPFMIVTQMLASMEHNPVPTRAEVSDIYNAVLDGADSIMVTGETAVGDYPVEVIRYLANTAKEATQTGKNDSNF